MKNLQFLFFFLVTSVWFQIGAQTVYVTKTGEKYHTSSCRYLKYSKIPKTLDEVSSLGYVACGVCKPSNSNSSSSEKSNNLLHTSSSTSSSHKTKTTATQCTGKTQSGRRCKRMTKNANGRCYQH